MGPRATSLFAVLLLVPAAAMGQLVTLTGSVVDSATGAPVEGAMVYVLSGGRVTTDRTGAFRLKNVDPAKDVLAVRRLGYRPMASRLPRADGAELPLDPIRLSPIAYVLDPIQVRTDLVRENGRLEDFYRRRAGGKGWFMTMDEVVKRNPITTTELLRAAPGIYLYCEEGPCLPATKRRFGLGASQGVCLLQVVLDGVPSAVTLDDIPPAWISGIEVYRSGAETPPEFGATGKDRNTPMTGNLKGGVNAPGARGDATPFCGTVVVWTGGRVR